MAVDNNQPFFDNQHRRIGFCGRAYGSFIKKGNFGILGRLSQVSKKMVNVDLMYREGCLIILLMRMPLVT